MAASGTSTKVANSDRNIKPGCSRKYAATRPGAIPRPWEKTMSATETGATIFRISRIMSFIDYFLSELLLANVLQCFVQRDIRHNMKFHRTPFV
jgi:hypothetical protein